MAAEDDVEFKIHVIGERTKKTWSGDFRARRFLSHRQQLTKDRLYRELLGASPQDADLLSRQTAVILSDTAVGLSKAPEWWRDSNGGQDLVDQNVIVKVWEELQKIQGEAVKHLDDQAEIARQDLKKVVETSEQL